MSAPGPGGGVVSELDRSLRLRALIDQWFAAVVVVVLLVAALGGWWAYQAQATPEVEREQVTVSEWSEATAYEHGALIVNESIPFEQGERVTNRPVYYTSLSDELDVTYVYEYDAADGELRVTTETLLLFRGVEGEDVLWEYSEPLATGTDEALPPDDSHTVDATVDIDAVFATIDAVEEQLGAAGTIEIRIVSTSNVEGVVEGGAVDDIHESTMPITVTPQTFRVTEIEIVEESHQETDVVERPVEPETTEVVGSLLVVALSVVLLVGLTAGRVTGYLELSEDERELLDMYQQEQEFSDWITSGTFPSERDYEATILVDDLEGLVDVAIDTNKRVIKDEQLGVSTVLDGEYIYVYVQPDSPASDWLVNYADMTMDEFESYEF